MLDTLGQMITALNTPIDGDPVAKQKLQGAMEAGIGNIDAATNQIGTAVTSIGARGQSLDMQSATNDSLSTANTTTQGSIRDSDPAEVMTRLPCSRPCAAAQMAFSRSVSWVFNKI